MEDQFVWRGLVLEKTEGHRYQVQVTPDLEVGLYRDEHDTKWWAHVGLGYGHQEDPLDALEEALKIHLERVRGHLAKAREFERFAQQLSIGTECANCGQSLTLEDEQGHPGKCYSCAEGR